MIRPKTNRNRVSNDKTKKTKPADDLITKSTGNECAETFTNVFFEKNDLIPKKDTLQMCDSDIKHLQDRKVAISKEQEIISVKNSGPRYKFSTEIPDKYDNFYLCALPRDPQWLYVYWEFPDGTKVPTEKLIDIKSEIAQWILRIKTISSNLKSADEKHFDVPVCITDSNLYVKIPNPGYHYNIEYGYLTKEGLFTAISSTSSLTIPIPVAANELWGDTDEQFEPIRSANEAVIEKFWCSHDRSKNIPHDRSTKPCIDINYQSNNLSLKHFYSEEKRYIGSAAIH